MVVEEEEFVDIRAYWLFCTGILAVGCAMDLLLPSSKTILLLIPSFFLFQQLFYIELLFFSLRSLVITLRWKRGLLLV